MAELDHMLACGLKGLQFKLQLGQGEVAQMYSFFLLGFQSANFGECSPISSSSETIPWFVLVKIGVVVVIVSTLD
jgi:hypothetical protein